MAERDRVSTYIRERTGLAFAEGRRHLIDEAIERSMARANLSTEAEFIFHLASTPDAFDELIAEITVGETFFFRDPQAFDFIRESVLPVTLQDRPTNEPLRIWSAGCSSGEEAYSLAITVEEQGIAERTSILGTDISTAALAKARRAIYREWSFRATDPERVNRYFDRDGDDFRLLERLRRRVAFKCINLAGRTYPSADSGTFDLDLVLCRNVLIYLGRSTARAVAQRLFDALREGGWLITGPSDPPLWEYAPFEPVTTSAGVFYRRDTRSMRTSKLRARSRPDSLPQNGLRSAAARPEGESHSGRNAFEESHGGGASPAKQTSVSADVDNPGPNGSDVDRKPLTMRVEEAFASGEYSEVIDLTEPTGPAPEFCVVHLKALANLAGAGAAEQVAEGLTRRHPLRPEIHYLHAVMLLGLGRHDRSIAALRRVIYLDPSFAVAHLTLGSIYRALGDTRRARRAFHRAHSVLTAQPAEQKVPFSEDEQAGKLAAVALAQICRLESAS